MGSLHTCSEPSGFLFRIGPQTCMFSKELRSMGSHRLEELLRLRVCHADLLTKVLHAAKLLQ